MIYVYMNLDGQNYVMFLFDPDLCPPRNAVSVYLITKFGRKWLLVTVWWLFVDKFAVEVPPRRPGNYTLSTQMDNYEVQPP